MRIRCLAIFTLLLFILNKTGLAQNDSLLFNDGDGILGDLQSIEKGILKFSMKYSDSDFEIDWDKLNKIYTANSFLIEFEKGQPLYGTINSVSDSFVRINTPDSLVSIFNINEIVQMLISRYSFLCIWVCPLLRKNRPPKTCRNKRLRNDFFSILPLVKKED